MNETDRNQAIHDLIKEIAGTPSESQKIQDPLLETPETILEFWKNINLNSFQVVRREFFAHMGEPAVTFNNCKFYVNAACLKRFPDATSVHVLINREKKILAIKPCEDGAKDSYVWCRESRGKRSPKQISCKMFFAKVADMMGWNPEHRYRILGNVIRSNGETLLVFDLSATEIYQRIMREGKTPVNSRVPVFPADWQHQFGLPYNEHQQSMQVDIFDGYAIYRVKDTVSRPDIEEDAPAAGDAVPPAYHESMNQLPAESWR